MLDLDARSGKQTGARAGTGIDNTECVEKALASSRHAGGAAPPRVTKADKEGQGAEGTSEAEGRLEGQLGQRDPVPMGPTGPKRGFWGGSAKKGGSEVRFEPADLVDYYAFWQWQNLTGEKAYQATFTKPCQSGSMTVACSPSPARC